MTRRAADHSPALYVYTAGTIIVGLAVVAWSAATFRIDPAISLTRRPDSEGQLLGLVFWILVGLLGGLRVQQLPAGHGVLTFHLPFIIAATALGGPTAGAIVALVSTFEARELRWSEVPWYGTAANHVALALAAVVGGVVILEVRERVGVVPLDSRQAVDLVAIVLGSLVFALTVTMIVAGTVILRDRLRVGEAARVFDDAFRTTAAAEVILGWLLWMTYSTIGWWAALICVGLIVVIWKGFEAMERARRDPLSDLFSRLAFNEHLSDARDDAHPSRSHRDVDRDRSRWVQGRERQARPRCRRRGDPGGGPPTQEAMRLTDAAARLGGDEFAVLYPRLSDRMDALTLSQRVHAALCAPMVINGISLRIGASIGCVVIDPDQQPIPTVRQLHDIADKRMFYAKGAGGGVRFEDGPDDEPMTFIKKRRRKADGGGGAAARPAIETPLAEEPGQL